MKTVLFVKANDRKAEESVSVKMYETFLQSYRKTHPEDEIIEIDLYKEPLPYLGSVMISANGKASRGLQLSEEEQAVRDTVVKYMEPFIAADKVVMAFPLWNLTVPAVLHTYLDYMHHPGKSFRYSEEGAIGLLGGKKIVLMNARGGIYEPDNRSEMAVSFVRNHLNFFGITDITEVVIEGHHQFPERGQQIIEQGLQRVRETAADF